MKQDTLSAVTSLLNKHEGYFICWSGVYFDASHKMIRMDKVFLNVVFKDRFEAPRYKRLIGCIHQSRDYGTFVAYSLDKSLYRIADGDRRGRCVPFEDLRADDVFSIVGLDKSLVHGETSDCFSDTRKGDQDVINLLSNLPISWEFREPENACPDIYLTCVKGGRVPSIRNSVEALTWLRQFPDYDSNRPDKYNSMHILPSVAVPAGSGRCGFPLQYVSGRGVLAAPIISDNGVKMGSWMHVREFKQNTTHMLWSRTDDIKELAATAGV